MSPREPRNLPLTAEEAVRQLTRRVSQTGAQRVPLVQSAGRILARPMTARRDSPACDLSAMDGYALRRADFSERGLPVVGEVCPGVKPPRLAPGTALRVFTGAAVPRGADVVVPRELLDEEPRFIRPNPSTPSLRPGWSIRQRGENARRGDSICGSGTVLAPPAVAALADAGYVRVPVWRPVRVAFVTTGDELRSPGSRVRPWEIRDANSLLASSLLAGVPWLRLVSQTTVADDLEQLTQCVRRALREADAILLTGGVSAGDYDFGPKAVRMAGARIVFHRLAMRPGHPAMGAVGPKGQAVLGLPGNPVSAMVVARRLAIPVLSTMAHREGLPEADSVVRCRPGSVPRQPWTRFYPVRRLTAHEVEITPIRSSGDLAGFARSEGFIEVPPGRRTSRTFDYYSWQVV